LNILILPVSGVISQRHPALGIAPIAVAGAAAQRADARLVDRAGRQVRQHDAPGLQKNARFPPAALANLNLDLIVARVGDGREPQRQLFGAFVQDGADGGRGELGLRAVLAGRLEAGGKQLGHIMFGDTLNVTGLTAQRAQQCRARAVLDGSRILPANAGDGHGLAKGVLQVGHFAQGHERRGIGGIAGHGIDDLGGKNIQRRIGCSAETIGDAVILHEVEAKQGKCQLPKTHCSMGFSKAPPMDSVGLSQDRTI
jgi:hypothetical protein